MKLKSTKLVYLIALIFYISPLIAQDQSDDLKQLKDQVEYLRPGDSKFLLRGYAHSGLEYRPDQELTFVGGSFNPLFIYRQSERLLFEAELETAFEENEFTVALEYANISYLLTKTLVVRVGKIIVPFGIFTERLHPAWINKFPTTPLGYGHDGILPTTDIGIELRGGAYIGNLKYNYSYYIVNGAQLSDGSGHEDDAGKLDYGKARDNNFDKSAGARIGVFPINDSSLEIGLSGQLGKVGERGSIYGDVGSQLYAIDLTYVKNLNFIRSVIDFKGQYNMVNVDNAQFTSPEDSTETISFDNKSETYFTQLSIRPAFVQSNFIRNLEFAVRYSNLLTPEGSGWESDENRIDIGVNYWLNWRTVFKFTYQMNSGGEHEEAGEEPGSSDNAFFIHWAIGF